MLFKYSNIYQSLGSLRQTYKIKLKALKADAKLNPMLCSLSGRSFQDQVKQQLHNMTLVGGERAKNVVYQNGASLKHEWED